MDTVEVARQHFRLRSDVSRPWLWLDLPTFTQPLKGQITVDTVDALDRRTLVAWDGVRRQGDRERLSWTEESSLWSKRYWVDVYDGHVEFYADVQGDGDIDAIRFFGASTDAGTSRHSVGSPVAFQRVFCPEPNSYLRQEFGPLGYGQISTHWDMDYCGGNFVSNPAPLCFAVTAEPDCEWLAFGLAVEPGEYLFSEYEYLGGRDFVFRLNSWGARRLRGTFRTPRMVIVPATSVTQALVRYVEILRGSGLAPTPHRDQPGWWSRPIVCGWGHQSYQADLFRLRSAPERPPDNAAYMLSTQTNYRDIVEQLDAHDLPWGTLVIDARWFLAGGLKNVDVGRWPDLRGFIDTLHGRRKRVLLWWGPWDPEGIPADQCIRYLPGERSSRHPVRRLRFGSSLPGQKLAVDITLPSVRDLIRDQVRVLLGTRGFNADGLKIDHMSAVPGTYDMAFPEGSRRLFGIEAAHAYLTLLYDTVKEFKPDSLLIGQSPNPYLAGLQDMLRLGIATNSLDSVVPQVTFGAAMARIIDPNWLIDTNGWPIPSLTAFREYVDVQPALGVPSLYYATHLDTTGEAFTADDYSRIRRAWSRL